MFASRDLFTDTGSDGPLKPHTIPSFTTSHSITDTGAPIYHPTSPPHTTHTDRINKLTHIRQFYAAKRARNDAVSTVHCKLTDQRIAHLQPTPSHPPKPTITITTPLIHASKNPPAASATRTLQTATSARGTYNSNFGSTDSMAGRYADNTVNSPLHSTITTTTQPPPRASLTMPNTKRNTIDNGTGLLGQQQQATEMTQAEKSLAEHGVAATYDPIKPLPYQTAQRHSISSTGLFSVRALTTPFDMKQFVVSCPPRGQTVQCYIMRNKKGISNRLYPVYDLFLQEDGQFMMSSKKKSQNKTSNYIISNTPNIYQKAGQAYVGKVRSNFVGTEFVSYDSGVNPKYVTADDTVATLTVRQELASVFYESNILGSRGPRKMVTLIPTVSVKDNTRAVWRPVGDVSGMISAYKTNPTNPNFISLINKTPKWNDTVGAYVLNFNGRVTQASVKNFQLINENDPENVLLQFGRVDKDHFTMDYSWPLTALQAMQICMSSFDYKLACE